MVGSPQLKVGENAPDFCLPDQDGERVCLDGFRGRWLVFYFYPRDNTKACTMEATDFLEPRGLSLDAAVLGVSPDFTRSHQRFAERHGLKVTLLSDPEHGVLERYGVWQLKKRFGREYFGVVRSTFLIDPEGRIRHIWRNVRVQGRVEEVKQKLSELHEKSHLIEG